MKIENHNNVRVLFPEKGKKLIHKDHVNNKGEFRILSDKIYLAVNDSPDNYVEFDDINSNGDEQD